MHILFLSHYFPPEVNAPATRTYEHCKRWVSAGHTVTVVTCAPNCPDGIVFKGYRNRFRTVETVDGITIVRVWTYLAPNKGFARRIINYLSYMANAVVQSMAIRKIDVVIATSPQFFCGWAGVLVHLLKGYPFMLEIRDIWPESIVTVGAMRKSLVITFLEALEKIMYRSATHIIAVGEGYRRRIMQKGIDGDTISIVINGVDLERFTLLSDATTTRSRYRGDNKFICTYLGTVGMAHGLEVVLKAAQMCKSECLHDIIFWIVGDGAERSRLEMQATNEHLDNVVFTGRLSKEEMPSIITASDSCLVHLRKSELFSTVIPSKIFELMAMNVPIIMGVRGEAEEIVLQGNAGVVMEPDNPTSLLQCIAAIRNRGRASFMGRAFVAEQFDRNVLADKMLTIVKKYAKNT